MPLSEDGPDNCRLTVRYLADAGQIELGCTRSGDRVLVPAADLNMMLTAVQEFASTRPCCVIS